jgi:hypothetical protein
VTSDPPSPSDNVRTSIAELARTLPAADVRCHVFVEDRVDHRIALSSSGPRETVVTQTRGMAISGRRSLHGSEVGVESLGTSALRGGHENWVGGLAEVIAAAGDRAATGLPRPHWSAKAVAFYQEVWVGIPGQKVLHDVRRGCRVELTAQLGRDHESNAVEELIVRLQGPFPVGEAFSRAFDRAEARRATSAPPQVGSTAAVFAPGAGGIVIHELVGHALEGDVIAQRRSWIGDQQLPGARRPVSVVDDPRRGRGAWSSDDEGISARETTLVERGRQVGMLLDRSSAKALGAASTGHGRRSSYLDPVGPRMGCTFIEPGDDDPAEAVRSTRSGVFIRRLVAGHTNSSTGLATFVVSDADRIVDGRIAEPLDSFVLELNGPEAWSSIDRIGADLMFDTCVGSCVRDGQPLAVSVGAPTIRIGVVRVRC